MIRKTYSNGTEQIDAETLLVSGVQVATDLRTEHGYFTFEADSIDAPEWMAAGSMLRGLIRGDTPATVPAIVLRN